jgi:hypothetical protein
MVTEVKVRGNLHTIVGTYWGIGESKRVKHYKYDLTINVINTILKSPPVKNGNRS